jgi:DNA-binding MarR family transcriptional regulator
MDKQYVILPKKENGELLQKYEILIYVCIRRYMNAKTMKAFPSLDTIAKDSGCSKPTILKIIKEIERKGYIKTELKGGVGNVYTFNNEKSFEPFSYEFLDNPELNKSEKLQILCTQQYMYKNDGIGKVSYSDRELAKLTGLDRSVISKNNNSLMSKNLMTQVTLQSRDSETGLMNKETIYHLNELGQAIVFAITNHEERIQQNTQDIETLKSQIKDNQILLAEIKRLQEENKALKGLDIPRQFEF